MGKKSCNLDDVKKMLSKKKSRKDYFKEKKSTTKKTA